MGALTWTAFRRRVGHGINWKRTKVIALTGFFFYVMYLIYHRKQLTFRSSNRLYFMIIIFFRLFPNFLQSIVGCEGANDDEHSEQNTSMLQVFDDVCETLWAHAWEKIQI